MRFACHRNIICTAAIAMTAATSAEAADWLEEVWSDASVRMNGSPAISLRNDGVTVVLPAAALAEAYDAGLGTETALRDFIERYGPRCSDLLDLNLSHPDLAVGLSLQVPARPEDVPSAEDVLTALKRASVKYSAGNDLPLLFTVSPLTYAYTIDYVPTHQVRCIAPGEGDESSS